jgi:hypothetical protein
MAPEPFADADRQAVLIQGLELARALTEQMLTLSLAFLGFSITFLSDVVKRAPSRRMRTAIGIAWAAHLLSILSGLVSLMGLTGTLLPGEMQSQWLKDVSPGARLGSTWQLLAFGAGTVAFCVFGWLSLKERS